jgi:hypothetical protein
MRLRGTLLAVSMLVPAVTGCASDEGEAPVEGVVTADYPGGVHTSGEVDYAETPPMGGQHDPQWLACGVYDRPVREENAVHTLEHGTTWITYDAEQVTGDDLGRLEDALGGRGVLSPHEDLPAPVVVTAWNRQLPLEEGADDAGLDAFLDEYADGHTAPEANVGCQPGVVRFEDE